MRPSYRAARIAKFAILPGALLVSALVISQASHAAFSATTSNPGNTWASGTLTLTNDAKGTALFNATNIKPGDTGKKCITVSTTSSVASTLMLYATNFSAGTNNLGDRINLTVTGGSFPGTPPAAGDCSDFVPGKVVASSVPLSTLATTSTSYASGLDSFALEAGKSRTYKIEWAFVSAGSTILDNTYQGDTASIGLTWESQS